MPGFIQITDTHIVAPGALACGRSDTGLALRRTIETINAKRSLLDGIDCVIVTGDLTDHGRPEEYAHFAALMQELTLPWLAVPGNHDRRAEMRAAFAAKPWMPQSGPIHWLRDFGPFSVIALDTLLEGAHHGHLDGDGFAFLDAALAAMGDQPVVIATHHPWMQTGIPAMDADNLRNGAALIERLEAHPATVRMLSGHVHRAMTGQIGRINCQIAPATCHAVLTDHRSGPEPQLILEPGAFSVCRWIAAPGPGLVSDQIPTGVFSGPWPFQD
ncbi:phosphodiesterase [Pseudophaeobacter flagellatus]|uniref:phosphodiesterase n=1 Tax=Pseudophaeobacter flagellatus TaxID=2899119 RepID=UPI001E41D541|nr:phosphodiesterase [Pseudophaeobacter flagellatus]MCD9147926.1 phosphodiesterase [Pseudophaeobacter flagellatus]